MKKTWFPFRIGRICWKEGKKKKRNIKINKKKKKN